MNLYPIMETMIRPVIINRLKGFSYRYLCIWARYGDYEYRDRIKGILRTKRVKRDKT